MKKRFEHSVAQERAKEIKAMLSPFCEKITIAGSIRRNLPQVGDIEILYIPKRVEETPQGDLIAKIVDKSQERILSLIKSGIIDFRKKRNGTISFGQRVKLLIDKKSGIPLDLFSCQEEEWINNLVSRTGGKMTNITIASYAKRLGWNWKMSGAGFINHRTKEFFQPQTEEEVFGFARVPYMEPEERS
jgi:DNA polymerase/3'-5' exonuclease PolX